MTLFNTAVLMINVLVLIIVSNKIKELRIINEQYLRIKNSMDQVSKENSDLIDLILGELDERITEARGIMGDIREQGKLIGSIDNNMSPETLPPQITCDEQGYPQKKKGGGVFEIQNSIPSLTRGIFNKSHTKILSLKEQGFTVQEIAEKLNIPQGEIALKINLYDQQQSGFLNN